MNTLARLNKLAGAEADPPELRAALSKAYAPVCAALDDLERRLNKIDATPWPLWMTKAQPANEALASSRETLEKAVISGRFFDGK